MSKQEAEKFFDKLEKETKLRSTIKQGLEKLAKDAGYDATEEELTAELAKRWKCKPPLHPPYSEPPGF
jgi:FKBP-type peptidyl-prolyl cis-trans isomerase (trigger factor)